MSLLLLSGQEKRMPGIMLVDLDKLGVKLQHLLFENALFTGFMKCNPHNFHGAEGAVKLKRWFEKTKITFGISECVKDNKVKFIAATLRGPALTWWNSKVTTLGLDVANQMGWTEMKKLMIAEFCPAEELQRMENELWNLKVKEYNMGEVTSSKPTNLNEVVCMAHKLMEQKLQARNERILEGNRQKWENFQSGNSSAMTTAPNEERCLLDHFLCVNVVLLAMLVNIRSSATSVERLGTKRGHTRNRCPKKVKQEEVGEARGRAYAIKDAEPQGPNVVTGVPMEMLWVFTTSFAFLSGLVLKFSRSLIMTLDDLAASNPSVKVVANTEASQKRKASPSRAVSSHVAKRTSNDDDGACYEIPIVTPICSAVMIPSSRNQGGGSASPATEGPNTQYSWGKDIMTNVDAAPSVGASCPRASSGPASSFRDVSKDAIHIEFFPFSPGPYYAT
ncbi:reverse transcriptase domain-containing protein [Tanacetum coccineum]